MEAIPWLTILEEVLQKIVLDLWLCRTTWNFLTLLLSAYIQTEDLIWKNFLTSCLLKPTHSLSFGKNLNSPTIKTPLGA